MQKAIAAETVTSAVAAVVVEVKAVAMVAPMAAAEATAAVTTVATWQRQHRWRCRQWQRRRPDALVAVIVLTIWIAEKL